MNWCAETAPSLQMNSRSAVRLSSPHAKMSHWLINAFVESASLKTKSEALSFRKPSFAAYLFKCINFVSSILMVLSHGVNGRMPVPIVNTDPWAFVVEASGKICACSLATIAALILLPTKDELVV